MSLSWGRFDTRTLVLIPIAIAINIVLGQTVAAVLKVPIYLDSIGTVLVGVLAGPLPGLVTGLVSNLLWTYVLPAPFHSDFAAPFAVLDTMLGREDGSLTFPAPFLGVGTDVELWVSLAAGDFLVKLLLAALLLAPYGALRRVLADRFATA